LKSTGVVDGDVMYRNIVIDSGGLLKSQMVQNMSKLEK
jgi:cytoskeletal protein CcmA (bactofilin family)